MANEVEITSLDSRSIRLLAEVVGEYLRRTSGGGRSNRRTQVRSAVSGLRNVTLTGNMTSGSATITFDDFDDAADTAYDPHGAWDNAATDDEGLVAWINGQWQFIDIYNCDAVT